MRISLLVSLLCTLSLVDVSSVSALNNGLALTPQMGWNSWNKFGCDVSDSLLRSTAEAMVDLGLLKMGYKYLNVDDCWQLTRDNVTGVIQPDPTRFPNGMQPLIEYVHSLGLLFGLYSDAGTNTCQGRPGSLGYETIDAQTYASWGVDYLKYDNCNNKNIKPEIRYPPMRDALNATGRDIFFSMCEWGQDNPYTWAPQVGNSWRTTGDIKDNWDSMMSNIDQNDVGAYAAGPGGWNDPDMLEIGNGGMTDDEYRVHFSLWALTKAPLILGMDLTNLDNNSYAIISNYELIAVNQDTLGLQGTKVFSQNGTDIWSVRLSDGWAVALVNRNEDAASLGFTWSQIGAPSTNILLVKDLWTHEYVGNFAYQFPSVMLRSHACVVYKLVTSSVVPKVPIILHEN